MGYEFDVCVRKEVDGRYRYIVVWEGDSYDDAIM